MGLPAARPRPGSGLSDICDHVHVAPDEKGGGGEGVEVRKKCSQSAQGGQVAIELLVKLGI